MTDIADGIASLSDAQLVRAYGIRLEAHRSATPDDPFLSFEDWAAWVRMPPAPATAGISSPTTATRCSAATRRAGRNLHCARVEAESIDGQQAARIPITSEFLLDLSSSRLPRRLVELDAAAGQVHGIVRGMTDDDRSRPGDPVPGPAVAGPGLLLSESFTEAPVTALRHALAAAAAYRGLPGPLGKDFVL